MQMHIYQMKVITARRTLPFPLKQDFWHFFDTLTKEPNIKVGVAQTLWLICGVMSSLDVRLFNKGAKLLSVKKVSKILVETVVRVSL